MPTDGDKAPDAYSVAFSFETQSATVVGWK